MDNMQRNTRQREAIRQAFAERDNPMTPVEVLEAAREHVRTLGIATVYRNLSLLCESGWLARVELPGNRVYFERADKDHHHHFLCESCEKLYEVNGCLGDVEKLAPRGCRIKEHDLLLHGTCDSCRRTG